MFSSLEKRNVSEKQSFLENPLSVSSAHGSLRGNGKGILVRLSLFDYCEEYDIMKIGNKPNKGVFL